MKKTGIALGIIGQAASVIGCGAALVSLIMYGTGAGAGELLALAAATAAAATCAYKMAVKMEVETNE